MIWGCAHATIWRTTSAAGTGRIEYTCIAAIGSSLTPPGEPLQPTAIEPHFYHHSENKWYSRCLEERSNWTEFFWSYFPNTCTIQLSLLSDIILLSWQDQKPSTCSLSLATNFFFFWYIMFFHTFFECQRGGAVSRRERSRSYFQKDLWKGSAGISVKNNKSTMVANIYIYIYMSVYIYR